MSVINKYPFINTLLGSLTSEQLKDLNDCINGQYEGSVVFRTLKSWGDSLLTESDKGIYPIQLELNGPAAATLPGYLIYTDDYCVLISYADDDACKLTIVNITMPENGSDIKWEYVSESLTVNELRSSLFDAAAGEGGGSGGGGSGASGIVIDLTNADFVEDGANYSHTCNFSSEKDLALLEQLKDFYVFDEQKKATHFKQEAMPTITFIDPIGVVGYPYVVTCVPYTDPLRLRCSAKFTMNNGNEAVIEFTYNVFYNKAGAVTVEATYVHSSIIH